MALGEVVEAQFDCVFPAGTNAAVLFVELAAGFEPVNAYIASVGSSVTLQAGVFSGLLGTPASGSAGPATAFRFPLRAVTTPVPDVEAGSAAACVGDCTVTVVVTGRVSGALP